MNEHTSQELCDLANAFQAWLDREAAPLAPLKHEPPDFEGKLRVLVALQHALYDAGWALHGWPEELGGRGGSVLHRGVIVDVLERNGFPPRHIFEHLDILPPALAKFAGRELLVAVFLPTLRGDLLWCQGFSEPSAGSDLAALRTRARKVDGGYRIDGHKIWTSWAKWATHCLFLARTGEPEDRHRGLTAFVIETKAPGVTVGAIRQANGSDEFAEVFFDDAFVPETWRVGEEGQGWAVAMHILAGERGSYTWLRQCEIFPKLEWLSQTPRAAEHADGLGESLMRLVALRCRSREVMETLARGEEPGPESSVTKVLAIDTEQHFYDVARDVLSPGLDLGTADEIDFWQEHYFYSRASSVYGGSRQIQLNVIGKLMTTRGSAAEANRPEEEQALRASVADAIDGADDGRTALDGLDWWAFAREPGDAFGRAAFSAWFEQQGAALVTSPALAGTIGAPVAELLGVPPQELALVVGRHGDDLLVTGLDAQTRFAIDLSDGVVRAFATEGMRALSSRAFDAALVTRLPAGREAPRAIELDAAALERSLALARTGVACEILGASRRLLGLAVRHANEREQFGQPIAGFQAIQHLISESQIEISALEALCCAALEEWCAGEGAVLATIAKARAGRDGRAIAQRALQCFGALGFTDEHPHHRYSRRIHTLDALLGDSSTLRRQLGEALVATGRAPRGIEAWRPDATAA